MMKRLLAAMILSSAIAINVLPLSCTAATPVDVVVKVDRTKVRIDEENQSVFFTTSPVDDYEGTYVSLIDGVTGEKVIELYDDGGFQIENDGDVYMNDSCYSNYLDFSDKEIGDYSYYVQYTDENGTDCKSESVTVHVYRGFTEQELADMSKVDDAISELTNSGKFKTMKTEEKVNAVMTLLSSLEDEGLVHSIVLPENRLQIEFQYSTGVQSAILSSVFIYEPEVSTTEPEKISFTPNPKFVEFLENTNREVTVQQTDKGIRIAVYNYSGDPSGHPIPPLKMTVPSGWQITYSTEVIHPSPQTVGEGIINEKNFIYYVLVEKTEDVVYTENEILDWYLSMDIGSEPTITTASPLITTETTVTTIVTDETNTEQITTLPATGTGSNVSTENSTVPTTATVPAVTSITETKLPQTGYSIWYQSLVALAMGMVGIGSAVIVRSGVFSRKESNS